eukprot:GHVP01014709.1.p3 GENE.GHVP01014709.1~~GHVP01014709.1.p3  ORF type:complete len:243 (-),score=56.46 GHVP01014709.1:222-950(-)
MPHVSYMGKGPSSVVFVGNISYEATDDDVIELLSTVGRVESFRVLYDRETRKSRGYGFCHFSTPEAADAAIRNLDGIVIHGRKIKVGRSDSNTSEGESKQQSNARYTPVEEIKISQPGSTVLTKEGVQKMVEDLGREKRDDILKATKGMLLSSNTKGKKFLKQNLAFCHVLAECLILNRIVTPQEFEKGQISSHRKQEITDAKKEKSKSFLMKIMNMTDEDVKKLPEKKREEILTLKRKLSS